jgi:hypothetical protein
LTLLSQYQEGSNVGGQGNGTGNTLSNADLWGMYWSGAGAGSSSASTEEGSIADYATISAQYTGGSGIGGITPLVYNPESDGPPVFHSGVFTGDHGSVQFVQTADTGSQNAGTDPPNRPTWDDVKDWYSGPQWQFELEAELGLYDSAGEESKPKDEFSSIPTDENGNYSWKTTQDFKDFIGRTVQLGKDFAWHMAEWFGDRAIGATAEGGVKLIDAAGASLPLWFVTRCGTVIERGSVALGLSDRLDNFATTIGGQTWKQLVPESPELWRRKFLELLNDGQTRFTFYLDGVDVWAGMARAAKGSGGFTDWELLQLRMAKDSWKRITWMKDGVVVACPFE